MGFEPLVEPLVGQGPAVRKLDLLQEGYSSFPCMQEHTLVGMGRDKYVVVVFDPQLQEVAHL